MWVNKLRLEVADLGFQAVVSLRQVLDVLVLSLHCVGLVLERTRTAGHVLLPLPSLDRVRVDSRGQ